MTEPTQPDLPKDATAEEIEADIAETRARLAESVDALADKVDVKAQAQRKVDDTKAQVREKVADTRAQVQEKVADTRVQVQEKVAVGREKVTGTSKDLLARFRSAPRPAQIGIVAAPVAALVVLIARKSR